MATFCRRDLKDSAITEFRVKGDIQPGEMLEFIKTCDYDTREYRALWDLREASWSNIPIQNMLNAVDQLGRFSREGQRTAFVFGRDVDFGIGRMLEPHYERYQIKSKVWPFLDYEEATAWLLQDPSHDKD